VATEQIFRFVVTLVSALGVASGASSACYPMWLAQVAFNLNEYWWMWKHPLPCNSAIIVNARQSLSIIGLWTCLAMGAAIALPEGDSIEKDYIVFGWLGGALLLVVWATCRLRRLPAGDDSKREEEVAGSEASTRLTEDLTLLEKP